MSDVILLSEDFEGELDSRWALEDYEILNNRYGNPSHFLTNNFAIHPIDSAAYFGQYRKSIPATDLLSLNFRVTYDAIRTDLAEGPGWGSFSAGIIVYNAENELLGQATYDNPLLTLEWESLYFNIDNIEITGEDPVPAYIQFYFSGNCSAVDNLFLYSVES